MALNPPATCALTCIENAVNNSGCLYNVTCLCKNQPYIAAAHACAKTLCSPADYQLWDQYGIEQCAAVGVFFTSTAASNTPTPAATSTNVVLATSVVVFSTTLTNSDGVAYSTVTAAPLSPSNPASPITSNNPTPVSSPQSSDGGLSTGAKVGIAVGAVGFVLIGILVALLLWRQIRKRPKDVPLEARTDIHGGDAIEGPYREKEATAPTSAGVLPFKEPITGVFASTELSADQAKFAEKYQHPDIVPELFEDPARVKSPWSASEAEYPHELSPSSAHTELTAVIPSEVAGSGSLLSSYDPYHHNGPAEADSQSLSHNAPPRVPALDKQWLPAQELSSSPSTRPAMLYNSPHPASSIAPIGVGQTDGGREDVELDRMKAEIEALRVEKERIQHLQAIEAREQELSRKIVQRELSKGAGGPS